MSKAKLGIFLSSDELDEISSVRNRANSNTSHLSVILTLPDILSNSSSMIKGILKKKVKSVNNRYVYCFSCNNKGRDHFSEESVFNNLNLNQFELLYNK